MNTLLRSADVYMGTFLAGVLTVGTAALFTAATVEGPQVDVVRLAPVVVTAKREQAAPTIVQLPRVVVTASRTPAPVAMVAPAQRAH